MTLLPRATVAIVYTKTVTKKLTCKGRVLKDKEQHKGQYKGQYKGQHKGQHTKQHEERCTEVHGCVVLCCMYECMYMQWRGVYMCMRS